MTEKLEYLYKIQPVRQEMLKNGSTPEEQVIIEKHYNYLKDLTERGIVIIAGRTLNIDQKSFGIVILHAESDEKAMEIMMNDPGVQMGVFNSELFPFRISLLSKYLIPESD